MAELPIWSFSKGSSISFCNASVSADSEWEWTKGTCHVGQMTNVRRDALHRRTQSAESVGHAQVNLAGVGLSGNVVACREASLLAEEFVELVDLVAIALEELEERGLGPGGALGASELKLLADVGDVLEIHHELLRPGSGSLANCDHLGRLVVGVAQSRLVLPLQSEVTEVFDNLCELGQDEVESIAHEDQFRVVSNCTQLCQ